MDVITCGEVLVDFFATEVGVDLAEATRFTKAPGGAPANVAVGLSRLGHSAGFLGQVGDDAFGHFLADVLTQNGVDVRGLHFSTEARTGLAFVSLRADGERDFTFYRHGSAAMHWHVEDLDPSYLAQARVFHYGSISLIQDPARTTTLTAVHTAAENSALLSYDPNLRLALWPSPAAARDGMREGWRQAHVIKISEEELRFLSDVPGLEGAARGLWHERLRLLAVTQGEHGCTYFTRNSYGHLPAFTIRPRDTTGAGDAFVAGMLSGLLAASDAWDEEELERALTLANAVAALSATRIGAMTALPSRERLDRFVRSAAHRSE